MDLVQTKFIIIAFLGLILLSLSFAVFTGIKEQLEFVILILFGYLYGLLTGVMVLYLETTIEDVEAVLTHEGLLLLIEAIAKLYDYNFVCWFKDFLLFGDFLIYGLFTYISWVQQLRRKHQAVDGLHPIWIAVVLTFFGQRLAYFAIQRLFQ